MRHGPTSAVVVLTEGERVLSAELARRRKTPRDLSIRAQLLLFSADHPMMPPAEIGGHVGLCRVTVHTWRKRFITHRMEGLSDAPKSGAPRSSQNHEAEQPIWIAMKSPHL